jgi:hypothetical protein
MRKNMLQALYIVLMGLFIYSCSGLTLPEHVRVKGTVNLPIRVGAANLNETLKEKIEEAFKQEGSVVYNVDYEGQEVQTFCLYIPIEMTEDLNPNSFLKTMDDQINGGINMPPQEIDVTIPSDTSIPISTITALFAGYSIPSVSLKEIAGYVRSIDFDRCNAEDDSKGIGLNFYIYKEIPRGLDMIIECEELHFSSTPTHLKQGDNIFGNKEEAFKLVLDLLYQNDTKKLNFTMRFQPAETDSGYPNTWNPEYFDGATNKIEGQLRLFRKWTQAEIDLAKALKASGSDDNVFGKFPANPFDLSDLNNYFDGGFKFTDDLEVKIYMDGPDPDAIDYSGSRLILKAQYDGKIGNEGDMLYDDPLSINKDPTKLDDHLVKKGDEYFYKDKDLPGSYHTIKDENVIIDIFQKMPADLSFIFTLEAGKDAEGKDKPLIIKPEAFHEDDDASAIKTTMMIMLPMTLIATGEGGKKSTLSLPDMFGEEDDLLGREEHKELFSKGKINNIKMTINFSYPIFTRGLLFINDENELFPDGIQLTGPKTEVNFTQTQFERIEEDFIYPKIRIEIEDGGTVNIPKDMAIMSIKFKMKGLVNVGDLKK